MRKAEPGERDGRFPALLIQPTVDNWCLCRFRSERDALVVLSRYLLRLGLFSFPQDAADKHIVYEHFVPECIQTRIDGARRIAADQDSLFDPRPFVGHGFPLLLQSELPQPSVDREVHGHRAGALDHVPDDENITGPGVVRSVAGAVHIEESGFQPQSTLAGKDIRGLHLRHTD